MIVLVAQSFHLIYNKYMNNGSISIYEYFGRWQIVLQEKILLEAATRKQQTCGMRGEPHS